MKQEFSLVWIPRLNLFDESKSYIIIANKPLFLVNKTWITPKVSNVKLTGGEPKIPKHALSSFFDSTINCFLLILPLFFGSFNSEGWATQEEPTATIWWIFLLHMYIVCHTNMNEHFRVGVRTRSQNFSEVIRSRWVLLYIDKNFSKLFILPWSLKNNTI